MKNTVTTTAAGQDTWREVIALLVTAADHGREESITDPVIMNTAWGAGIAAAAAIELLPREDDHKLDQVHLDLATASMSMAQLLRAAETVTMRHPIEQLPIGASRVIVQIRELSRELPQ